jgi:hypothetical protein
MRKIFNKILIFLSFLVVAMIVVVFLPATPRASKSLLFGKIRKDSLMQHAPSPRIIFIGGSNLSFGLDSKTILDSTGYNPINTGIHMNIGLIYMMENALPYIKSDDVVVVIPEYSQFFGNSAWGGNELLRTILDVKPKEVKNLSFKQWKNIIGFVPRYFASKLNPKEYLNVNESIIYSVNSFNKFGDEYRHWTMEKTEAIKPCVRITENLNEEVLKALIKFRDETESKKALFFISYPCFQSASYLNSKAEILRVDAILRLYQFNILGNPESYTFPDSMIFDKPYHLTKKGVDIRTLLLIEDLKKYKINR